MGNILWALVTILGVIIFAAVLIGVIRKNKQSDIPMERTERATDELYEEIHAEEEQREDKTA